jgi:hypothetical protein
LSTKKEVAVWYNFLMKALLATFEDQLPILAAVTILSGLVYLAVQQDIRIGGNDPQIQLAEDAATSIGNGTTPQLAIPSSKVNVDKSLAPFMIIYDDKGNVLASSALLDGKTPALPSGVFESVRASGEARFTWQPQVGVRLASVVTRFSQRAKGFVLAGRNMREIEKREDQLLLQVEAGWLAAMVAVLLIPILVRFLKGGKLWKI